ncbi:MAG: cation transporter [Hamadaea sp.]|nr:cation transporter [Hamadaea sp.]
MGHGHDHSHGHGHAPGAAALTSAGARHKRALTIAFGLTAAYMLAEVIGGLATGSLALLSDAAHMGTDTLGLGMALAAIALAARPSPDHHTYGRYRLEVLVALANGVLLFAVAIWVLYEAWQRWSDPPEVPGLPTLLIASGGLVVNIIGFLLLRVGAAESLNVKGAYLEVLGDMLGSVGVIVGGLIIILTGWRYTDPIVGVLIGLMILPRTWSLIRQALRVLLESAPPHVDVAEVKAAIAAVPGVTDVHDLHIWTITSGLDAVSVHVVIAEDADAHGVLDMVSAKLNHDFEIAHSTVQVDPADHREQRHPV